MLISRRVLVTAVLCLALLASASVAGASVMILSTNMSFRGGVYPPWGAHIYGIGFNASHGGTFHGSYDFDGSDLHQQEGWPWPEEENPYYGQSYSGSFSDHITTHTGPWTIGMSQSAQYDIYNSLGVPDWKIPFEHNWMGYRHEIEIIFELTHQTGITRWGNPWGGYGGAHDSWIDLYNLDTGGSVFGEDGWGPFWYGQQQVIMPLEPGTYRFAFYDARWANCVGGHYSLGADYTAGLRLIPEPAYLSFVALAIFGLATWRKRAERRSV